MNKAEILLVEDSSSDAFLFKRAMANTGYEVNIHVVRNGEEALDYLFARNNYQDHVGHLPKVVFLDLKLPKVNGLEVLEQVKSHPQTCHVPVVVLSSSGEDRDLKKAYELGVNSYLIKPFDMDNYNQMISNVTLYWLGLNQIRTRALS